MITCPNCKTNNEDRALFCQNCGASLSVNREISFIPPQTNKCPHCGGEININAVFCRYCGRDLRIELIQESQRKSWGKYYIGVILFIVITAVIILSLTNPSQDEHNSKILTTAGEAAGEELGGEVGAILGKLLGNTVGQISNMLNLSLCEYHNYWIFSTTTLYGRVITVGYLSNVKVIAPIDEWVDSLVSLPDMILNDPGNTVTPQNSVQGPTPVIVPTEQTGESAPAMTSKAIRTASGLIYEDLQLGSGAMAQLGDTVTVNYTGWLPDGTKFDSTLDNRLPFSFTLGNGEVISGWDEGIQGIRLNGTRLLVIPPELAYGSVGFGSVIPPDATLTFEVQLVAISPIHTIELTPTPESQNTPISLNPIRPVGKIVYTCEVTRNGDIFDQVCIVNPDGTGQQQLTNTEGSAYYPSISPDGKHVVFISNMSEDHDIYDLNLETSQITRLTTGLGDPTSPRISPDGALIAFTNQRNKVVSLNIMNRDGSNIHAIFTGGGLRPAWSPDGTQIAFYNDMEGSINVIDVNGNNLHTLTDVGRIGASVSWSPYENYLALYMGDSGNRQIYLMDPGGTIIRQVTTEGDNLSPTFSPDGNWIGFLCYPPGAESTKTGEICIIKTDGTGMLKLTDNQLLDWLPYWGP